ncbi:MAG: hypothetical protein SGPRY_010965, partial [Prymnesium sp.]
EGSLVCNGWVTYTRPVGLGTYGTLAQGSAQPALSTRKLREERKGKRAKEEFEMANKWIARLFQDTEELVEERLGDVNQVVRTLLSSAWHGDGAEVLLGSCKADGDLLLRDVCEMRDARVWDVWDRLRANLHENPGREEQLRDLFTGASQLDETARPSGFFQVGRTQKEGARCKSAPHGWHHLILSLLMRN